MRLLVGNTEVQNELKYTKLSRVLIFRSIFIALLIREQARQPWKDQEIQKTRQDTSASTVMKVGKNHWNVVEQNVSPYS